MKITAILASIAFATTAFAAAPSVKCADIPAVSFGSEVKIESATLTPATAKTPEHCDVRGTIWPEDQFAVKLPTAWNSRFEMVGNGGTAGTISLAAVDNGVRLGYAAASTNTGHDAKKEPLATFAEHRPDNPNAERKLIDYGYLAVHETALLAKEIIKAYYGAAPRYSYWVGCSTGGRQGFSEAQRYPEDFDGLVIGAPAINMSGLNMRNIWDAQVARTGPGAIAVAKLPLLADAVYKKCDAVDGLKDGLIDDPRRCKFDPAKDLPKCPADQDGPACFTSAQMASLKKIYDGVRTSTGKLIVGGQPPGAEVIAKPNPARPAISGWDGFIVASEIPLPRAESCLRFLFLDPPPGPEWTYKNFNFDADPQRTSVNAAKVNALNPDLSPLKKRGGKILHYHGWADTSVIPQLSTNYYEAVEKKIGAKETREFYKLYMVPGMFHCGGGVGCGSVDWLTPLVNWVEKGTAPGTLIGSTAAGASPQGELQRTRPICPYPEVARYKGAGSIDDAANFNCVKLR